MPLIVFLTALAEKERARSRNMEDKANEVATTHLLSAYLFLAFCMNFSSTNSGVTGPWMLLVMLNSSEG